MIVYLSLSHRKDKKYMVVVNGKVIHFGQKGYEDFTTHKDRKRMERYLLRHQKNEDWTESGILTAGWWSRFLLWNKPTIEKSIEDINSRFGIKVKFNE